VAGAGVGPAALTGAWGQGVGSDFQHLSGAVVGVTND
jgi:hypothetical protein